MPLGASPPYLCLWRRNFCAAGERSSLVTAVRFSNGQEALFIDYSGAKYTRFLRKSLLHKKHFFGWLKTANISIVCGTATLKSLLSQAFFVPDVHPRPRKRPPRCTLDCGFKTPESPALRGFVAERCPITGTSLYLVIFSNGPHRSKNFPVKFGFSPKTVPANIAKKLPPRRCPQPFLIPIFNFPHKRPTFAFTGESGEHTRLRSKNRTQRFTRRNRGLPFCEHSAALRRQRNRHQKESRRKRMHTNGVCPLSPASRPRWAALS